MDCSEGVCVRPRVVAPTDCYFALQAWLARKILRGWGAYHGVSHGGPQFKLRARILLPAATASSIRQPPL